MSGVEGGLVERYARVSAEIDDAARSAGRSSGELTTILVTKFHPAELIRELFDLGVRDFGENRHQEAQLKAAELSGLDIDWHFVGQLQSKKARAVRGYARYLHSLDRPSLLAALTASAPAAPTDGESDVLSCFIQINLSGEGHRGGVAEAELLHLAEEVAAAPSLRLAGVMGVAPLGEEPRRAFARLRECRDRVVSIVPSATAISAGMSTDFRDAIAEGATHLRIGSAITGNRPDAG